MAGEFTVRSALFLCKRSTVGEKHSESFALMVSR